MEHEVVLVELPFWLYFWLAMIAISTPSTIRIRRNDD